MSDEIIKALIAALRKELEDRKLKPQFREMKDDPATLVGEWVRYEQANTAFGVNKCWMKKLVVAGKVRAKKFMQDAQQSVVVFKTADIRRAIDEMPDYKFSSFEEDTVKSTGNASTDTVKTPPRDGAGGVSVPPPSRTSSAKSAKGKTK